MTPVLSRNRAAWRAAGSLRGVLRELFNLSLAQAEALDREDYDELDSLIERKAQWIPPCDAAAKAVKSHGWNLHDPSTYPADESCAALLRDAADLSRRLQAHEKYVLRRMLMYRNDYGERLDALTMKKQAVAGYRVPTHRGSTVDTSR